MDPELRHFGTSSRIKAFRDEFIKRPKIAMDRKPSDIIAELDAQIAEFNDKLRVGTGELHQSLINSYVFEDYLHPSEAIRDAEVVQRKLRRLLALVQEYLDGRKGAP